MTVTKAIRGVFNALDFSNEDCRLRKASNSSSDLASRCAANLAEIAGSTKSRFCVKFHPFPSLRCREPLLKVSMSTGTSAVGSREGMVPVTVGESILMSVSVKGSTFISTSGLRTSAEQFPAALGALSGWRSPEMPRFVKISLIS